MNESTQDFLADIELSHSDKVVQRKKSLPLWIKIFSWIFLIVGSLTPIVIIIGVVGGTASLSIYGLETNEPLSIIGGIVSVLFAFKAIVAFGLIWAKDWGANAAFIDGLAGCVICLAVMILDFINNSFSFRLELIALIPYILKMSNLRKSW